MNTLGNGLCDAKHHEEALSVGEAHLCVLRRFGASEERFLVAQSNLAGTYVALGHLEKELSIHQDVYSGYLKLKGEEYKCTLSAALNYANSLNRLQRHTEARSLLRKTMPVARRALGESHQTTLKMMWLYAVAFCKDDGATLDELREAVTTLEEIEQTARRVFGGAHPLTAGIEDTLRDARLVLSGARTPPPHA